MSVDGTLYFFGYFVMIVDRTDKQTATFMAPLVSPRWFPFLTLLLLVVLTGTLPVNAALVGEPILEDIAIPKVPLMKKGQLMYKMNLVFDTVPENHWVHYDFEKKKIVLEFFQKIGKKENLSMEENSIFSSFEMKNSPSELSLTGTQSQILIGADLGWHIQAIQTDNQTIQLRIWRELKQVVKRKSKTGWKIPVLIGAPTAIGLLTFILIIILSR